MPASKRRKLGGENGTSASSPTPTVGRSSSSWSNSSDSIAVPYSAFPGAFVSAADTVATTGSICGDIPSLRESSNPAPEIQDEKDELVCFGMIDGIKGEIQDPAGSRDKSHATAFPVKLDSDGNFKSLLDQKIIGKVNKAPIEQTEVLRAILEESLLRLQIVCHTDDAQVAPKSKYRRFSLCTLSIVLYGPIKLFEDVGDFLQQYDIYLQDPRRCVPDLDVVYYNPHRILSVDISRCPRTTELEQLESSPGALGLTEAPKQEELLDILNSQGDLDESPQPEAIQTSLKRHQKQALTFMLRREQGWVMDGRRPDVWELEVASLGNKYSYINRVSETSQDQEPEQFRGGIIADPVEVRMTKQIIKQIERVSTPHVVQKPL